MSKLCEIKVVKRSIEVPKAKPIVNNKFVQLPIDSEGYLSMDLQKANVKGVRISFVRIEGRKKRTIGLQIKNKK